MKILRIFIPMLLIVSCNSKSASEIETEMVREKATSSVRMFFEHDFKKYGTVDTLYVYKIDTLTPKKDSLAVLAGLYQAAPRINEILGLRNQVIDAMNESAKNTPYPKDLADRYNLKVKEKNLGNQLAAGFWKSLVERINKIREMDSLQQLDSVNFRGYIWLGKIEGTYKNGEKIVSDSIYMAMDKDFRIVNTAKDISEYYIKSVEWALRKGQ